jgi:cytoskeletal protein CcmA (bactofilin family)
MANVKISQLPEYTGNTSGSWLVMNNSGESTTYKVQRETILSGLATTSSLTSLSSSIAVTDLSQNNRLTSIESVTGSFAPSGNYATTGSNVFRGNQTITGSVNVTGSLSVTGSLNVSGNISAATSSNFRSVTFGDSFVGAGGGGNLFVPNGYVNTPAIFAESAPPTTGTLDIFTHQRLSLTASIGDVNISAGEFGGSPKNIRLFSRAGTINSGSLSVIGNTTITGSLTASGSLVNLNTQTVRITGSNAGVDVVIIPATGNTFTQFFLSAGGNNINTFRSQGDGVTAIRFINTGSVTQQVSLYQTKDYFQMYDEIYTPSGSMGSVFFQVNPNNTGTNPAPQMPRGLGVTGSLNMTGSLTVRHTSLGTTSITGNTIDTTNGSVIAGVFASNDQLNFFAGGTNNDVNVVAAGTGSILLNNRTRINGNTTLTGSLNISGSVNISAVMTLAKQNPLPTGTTGSLAVSGSGLYFHNGTSWNLIS